mgnify:CR=1 FL=1|tara:strand:+ start:389 stop:598 length:210 start_codon:yes stop_codon:yes gene_type:complete
MSLTKDECWEILEQVNESLSSALEKIGRVDDVIDDDRLDAGRGTISAYPLIERAKGLIEMVKDEMNEVI